MSLKGEIGRFTTLFSGMIYAREFAAATGTSEVVFNEAGNDTDFRWEGDTAVYLLATDAGDNKVGIGGAAFGTLMEASSTGMDFNKAGAAALDFKVRSDAKEFMLFVDSGNDAVLFGAGTFATSFLAVNGTEGVVVNNTGAAAIDFRVESANVADALFLDAGNESVKIGVTPVAAIGAGNHVAVYTVAAGDNVIGMDTSAGACAVTFPDGSAFSTGAILTVVDTGDNAGTNNITITPAAGLIGGGATAVIALDGGGGQWINDGTNWLSLFQIA